MNSVCSLMLQQCTNDSKKSLLQVGEKRKRRKHFRICNSATLLRRASRCCSGASRLA